MKQILQNLRNGSTEVADVPMPQVADGQLLIRTSRSLISTGTERMLIGFGKANAFQKARQQPDKVRQVLNKMRTDGFRPTIDAVRNKLDQPLPLGYCNVGTVIGVGAGVSGFSVGDRVASNGRHAEVVSVAENLCARVPDKVSDEAAAFTVVGAVALQGIRLIGPTLGEAVVVTGLGLIGLLAVQLLRANGCRVLGLDFETDKLDMARALGAEVVDLKMVKDPTEAALAFSRGRGVDAVLITASTPSSEPLHQAANMCRKRGRIVLVGVAGLELSRADFYEKELTFQVSCSYGPGRYDEFYEGKGLDYPVGFVRWTEQRNFEAILDMIAEQRIDLMPLVSHRFDIAQAEQAYKLVESGSPSVGIIINYQSPNAPGVSQNSERTVFFKKTVANSSGRSSVAFIGAGNYASGILIPAFRRAGARLTAVASGGGVTAVAAGRKFGFELATTDVESIIESSSIDAIVVATRHNTHGLYAARALEAGKSVFVEKPLCLTKEELTRITNAYYSFGDSAPVLMVGFNRRFAPFIEKIKELLASTVGPKAFVLTVNAGMIPTDHWTQDRVIGGGRIIGEACHFIDLLRHLAGCSITQWHRSSLKDSSEDTVNIELKFADGSVGTIHYFSNGHKLVPKERLEIYCAGKILQLDNFRKLSAYGWPRFKSQTSWVQDKGQRVCAERFVQAIERGSVSPIPFAEIIEVANISISLADYPESR